ncbi:MAG TPA: glycosyltransferase family 4 protein [Thermoanaerobaculia bacterium]
MSTTRCDPKPPARAKKSLRVALYEPSGHGGICHYTYQLAEALARRGCDVTVLTPASWELANLPRSFRVRFLARPSRVKRLLLTLAPSAGRGPAGDSKASTPWNARLSSWFGGTRRRIHRALLAAAMAMRRFDVVHVHSIGLGTDRRLVRLFRALRIPVLCTAHEALPHERPSGEELQELGELYGAVSRIIVHAERTRDELVRFFAVDARKIAVIPHGAYDLFFPNGRISRRDARARLGFPAAPPTILFFGLIRRYKGLEYLTEAFTRVQQAFPDAVLAIVGDIFRGDGAGFAEYSRLIAEVAQKPNVRRVAGYVPLDSVGLYLSAADVIVLPYTQTSQSGVLLAAFAAGRPAVVTDAGGLAETVVDGLTGLVVPARDAGALAAAILRVLRDPDAAEAMGRNSAREADTTYSWDRVAALTAGLYASTASGPDGSRAPNRAFQ